MANSRQRPTVALYHHLPPGGADRAMYELTRRTREQFRYVLFQVEPGPGDPFHKSHRTPITDVVDETQTFGTTARSSSRLSRWSRAIPAMLRAEARIRAAIEDLQPAAVVAHHQRFLHAPGALTASGVPSVYVLQEPRRRSFEYALNHDLGSETSLGRSLIALPARGLESWARRHDIRTTRSATSILCNSDHSREYVWRAYGRDSTVLRLGVDTDQFTLPGNPARLNELITVGSLDSTKGHEFAIAAIGRLDPSVRPTLRIVHNRGAPHAADALRKQAQDASVNIEFECGIGDELLAKRYQEARAVLLTARVEPLGLTGLEANACGTPAVAVSEGGYRETVVDGVTGYLTRRDVEDYAAGLRRILNGELKTSRKDLRAHVIDRFDWSDAVETYARSVDSAIASGADPSASSLR